MPEYLSPGVYVEEIDAGPKPIEGVSTSTAGAVGVTRRGPSSGKPELVTSFAEFQRKFGGFLDAPSQQAINSASGLGPWWLFPHEVRGFFDNGGQRLYVKRVYPKDDAAVAKVALGVGVIAELTADAAATDSAIRVRNTFGLQSSMSNVLLVVSGVPLAANPFTLVSYEANGTLHLNKPVGSELKAGRDYVEVVPRAAAASPGNLSVQAKAVGEWGNEVRVRVRPVAGATLRILGDPLLTDNAGATMSLTAPAVPVTGATDTTIKVDAVKVTVGDEVRMDSKIYSVTAINTPSPNDVTIAPAIPEPGPTIPNGTIVTRLRAGTTTLSADSTGSTITVNVVPGFHQTDHLLINGREYILNTLGTVTGTTRTFNIAPSIPTGVTWPAGTPVVRMASANVGGGTTLKVQGASQAYEHAMVELDNGTLKERTTVTNVSGQTVTFGSSLNNSYYDGHVVRIIEAEVDVQYLPGGVLQTTETFLNLRLHDDGSPSYIVRNVNEQSKYVELVELAPLSTSFTSFPSVPSSAPQEHWAALAGGADNFDKLKAEDFIGEDLGSGKRTGIAALEDIDEISICTVPGIFASSVHNALTLHCETLKDRFAILDPPDNLSIEQIREFRELIDTKYAALYYPWLVVRDPVSGTNVNVAPSGYLAGIYARVDVERGVHKAPANEVIRNIVRIAQDVTKREQDMLNPKGINALRFFPGRGNRVWGARTLTSDSEWKYINVRRLFINVEESIDEGTQWVVFEPNDEPLWARVRQTITNYLTTVWRSGALQGVTAKEAFFVRCDRSTMTQDDIDNGRLIVQIGIAPVKPAEFVIFRISQKTAEAKE